MQDERTVFFTTGQFAKLCRTTKETLFHYDSLGLLKPARIGENGYRYYAASQFFDFDLIAVLQSAGCSLKEIQVYMSHREPHAFAQLLRESEEKLLREREKLERMGRTLKNAVASTEEALSGAPGEPWLEEQPEGWLIATPVQGDVTSTGDVVRNLKDHIAYCDSQGLGRDLSVGSIVTRESLLGEDFRESYYSTKLSRPVESPWLYRKPPGLYACLLHRGPYGRLPESYRELLAFLRSQGCQVAGDSFETDLVSYLAAQDEGEFILKLEIQVQRLRP